MLEFSLQSGTAPSTGTVQLNFFLTGEDECIPHEKTIVAQEQLVIFTRASKAFFQPMTYA